MVDVFVFFSSNGCVSEDDVFVFSFALLGESFSQEAQSSFHLLCSHKCDVDNGLAMEGDICKYTVVMYFIIFRELFLQTINPDYQAR